jgi:hypothetical protein
MVRTTFYIEFIDFLKHQLNKRGLKLYKHRIFPGHSGGTYASSNVVYLSYYFHAAAHYVRYLTYGNVADLKASSMMLGQTEEEKLQIAQAAGKIGGKGRSKKMLEKKEMFYDPVWQKEHGFKGAGKRNVQSGHLEELNKEITKKRPEQRSKAGKLGAIAQHALLRSTGKGFFSDKHYVQKLGNLKRWGIKINRERIPFEKLSSDFIDYHIAYGIKTEY